MKRLNLRLTLIVTAALAAQSCGEKEVEPREPKNAEQNHFKNVAPKIALSDLKNEMAGAPTDLLRSFAQDRTPWQLWSPELLETAEEAQLPIFAFICSSDSPASRQVAREIDQLPELQKKLSQNALCTAVDTRLNPEMGNLSYHLANEINRSVAFPMALWLSHEGMPLAWIPIGEKSGKDLTRVVESALAMVGDIWKNSSAYAVTNSRRDNEARQERFDFANLEKAPKTDRKENFRRFTRQLSTFYRVGEGDLDNIGGLLPNSSLELLALGTRSGLLTKEVRNRCRKAVLDVSRNLITGAMRDPLDFSYFYARRSANWTLPAFTKNLTSQGRTATMFLKAGALLQEDSLVEEGLHLLKQIETNWLDREICTLANLSGEDSPDVFLWSFEVLKEILSDEELELATLAYSLRKEGNIPIEADPLGNYFELNSLRNPFSPAQLAAQRGLDETTLVAKLDSIREKLLQRRKESGEFVSESLPVLSELVAVLEAQIHRAACTRSQDDQKTALTAAEKLLQTYWSPDRGLLRFKTEDEAIPARGQGYSATALALTLLYQQTLDPKWLSLATSVFDRALDDLQADNMLLAETRKEDRVIPLRQHNISMIFGNSTLGMADAAASRLHALTGKDRYQELRDQHSVVLKEAMARSVVNHTDFVASCALGESPVLAILRGDRTTPAARELLAELNSWRNLAFLVVRPGEPAPPLLPTPDLPDPVGPVSVTLVRDHTILGQADSLSSLTALLDSVIANQP